MMNSSEAVVKAADWLRINRFAPRDRALIPHLKARFGISAKQVVEAIRRSHQEEDSSAPS